MSETDNEKMQDELVSDKAQDTASLEAKSKKSAKSGKASKKSARESAKETARLKKEWEDSLVASKRVKREEMRAKLKRAMLILLVFALIVTSIVYVMLLFIQENNIRITAYNRHKEKSISLSMDNDFWTPYLNAEGPENMWNVSYDTRYATEKVDSMSDVVELLNADQIELGTLNGEQFIRFTFMLKNTGDSDAHIDYEMTLDFDDKHDLHEAVRVMWGQSFKNMSGETYSEGEEVENPRRTSVNVYAALSHNERLAGNSFNRDRTIEDGFIECVAYDNTLGNSVSPSSKFYMLKDYEDSMNSDIEKRIEAQSHGYFATTPFESDEYVFKQSTELAKGDIMYCYVSIWLEGSDFDCVDSVLGGYCKLGLNFYAT